MNITSQIYKSKRNYIRIQAQVKQDIIRLVFKQGRRIIDAAKELNIKYATAKTIILNYKKAQYQVQPTSNNSKRCSCGTISDKKISFKIISKVAGDIVKEIVSHYP